MIDNSQCVATVTGTVGWEGLLRGKYALVFGQAWYQWCEGVFRVRNVQDAMNSIEIISGGSVPDIEKIKAFIKAVHKCPIRTTKFENDHFFPDKNTASDPQKIIAKEIEEYAEKISK